MSTLIAVYDSDDCVGRCDAKCYNATQPECTCICGGANHGAGLSQARTNTTQLADEQIKKSILTPGSTHTLRILKEQRQLELFA